MLALARVLLCRRSMSRALLASLLGLVLLSSCLMAVDESDEMGSTQPADSGGAGGFGGGGGGGGGQDAGTDGGAEAPCVDQDGDGYVSSCDRRNCPGKLNCDCDDSDPAVHLGAREVCGNGKDDDCDGLKDQADSACQSCSLPAPACASSWVCGQLGTQQCSSGCCISCPTFGPPSCRPGECVVPGGINPVTGCLNPPSCAGCCGCPPVYDPVCGENGSTYGSSCQAACAQVQVLHAGACLSGEGMSCSPLSGAPTECGSSGKLYCRDACPVCDGLMFKCTQVGVCAADWDCPAGLKPPQCSNGGTAKSRCVNRQCSFSCP